MRLYYSACVSRIIAHQTAVLRTAYKPQMAGQICPSANADPSYSPPPTGSGLGLSWGAGGTIRPSLDNGVWPKGPEIESDPLG